MNTVGFARRTEITPVAEVPDYSIGIKRVKRLMILAPFLFF